MEFQKRLQELNELIKEYIENGSLTSEDLKSLSLNLVMQEGVALRSQGHMIYNSKEFKIIKDTVFGIQSPTMIWLHKVNPTLPDLIVTLKVVKELDEKSFNSLLWLIKP